MLMHLKAYSALLVCLAVCLIAIVCGGCAETENNTSEPAVSAAEITGEKDFASLTALDMTSPTLKQEVTVKAFVDGDTTHFNVPTSLIGESVFKARYLAINTPESTGKIEEYGKEASEFTKSKLSSAESIIIESDDGKWNADSTGGRYLVWVWYRADSASEYRNLNIEILQNGLAIASSSANNRYGTVCTDAIAQAKRLKQSLYSGEPAPGFYYGEAVELTLKELRCNVEEYNNVKVAFSGVITVNDGGSVYIEDFDAETGLYYGISVYYGYSLSGEGLDIISVGNMARIVGTVQYYETGGTYQVSGLTYRAMKPNDPGNIQKLGDGYSPAYVETDAETFANGTVSIEDDDEILEYGYAELAMSTSVSMTGLDVVSAYMTSDKESANYGALTLTCESGQTQIAVRLVPFYDADGKLVPKEAFVGKTVSVKGMVDYYDGNYQIKVFLLENIVIE